MMSLQTLVTSLLLAGSTFSAGVAAKTTSHHGEKIAPKVFIVSMVGILYNNLCPIGHGGRVFFY
jgi:hypothetical protein